MTYIPKADLSFGGQLDAANRLRVSNLFTLLDLKQVNDNQPLLYDSATVGTGAISAHNTAEGGVTLTAAATGDVAIRQSKVWANYSAGKSQLIEVTVSDFHPQAGVTKRIGYFSSSTTSPYSAGLDGIFIETADNGTHTVNVYKANTQVHQTAQANWNIDPLDGTGPSGVTITGANWQRFQVWVIDFLYLGGTSVRFGVLFNGGINWVHQYDHALNNNTVQAPMIESPNQPIRYEIRGTEEGVQGTMNQICAQVSSEGAINNEIGVPQAIDTGNTAISSGSAGTEHAVLGYRLGSGYRNVTTTLQRVSAVIPSTAKNGIVRVRLNPTVAGTFTYSAVSNSAIESAVGASTNTITGGQLIDSFQLSSDLSGNLPQETALRAGSKIDGTKDEVVITFTPLSASTTIVASAVINQLL